MSKNIKRIISNFLLTSGLILSSVITFYYKSAGAEELSSGDINVEVKEKEIIHKTYPATKIDGLFQEDIFDNNIGVLSKEDYLDSFIDNVYGIIFNRESDLEGKYFWIDQILGEQLGILDFLNQILDQPEFTEQIISPEEFITNNYHLLFKREPDEEGLTYWMDRFSKDNSKDLKLELINEMAGGPEFKGIIESFGIYFKKPIDEILPQIEKPEYVGIDEFISDAYNHLLGRSGDLDGMNYWKEELTSQNKGALDLINEFIVLDEFKAQNLSDKEYINAIYEVLFNRSADSDGLNYWYDIYTKDKTSYRMKNIVFNIADDVEFLSRINELNIILKKVDLNLFYSEYLNSNNKLREITSVQLGEIQEGMSFFDIIVKLGRTKDVSNIDGVNIAKYIVDKSKEMYFIFSNPIDVYEFNSMDVFNSQN